MLLMETENIYGNGSYECWIMVEEISLVTFVDMSTG